MISTLLVPIGAFIFYKLSRTAQFTILTLSAMLPLSFGNFRSIPDFQFIEWLTVLTFLILINELVPVNRAHKRTNLISFRGIQIFIFAMLILVVWTIVSYVGNEILIESYNQVNRFGTTRIYFNIFVNVLLFFTIVVFITVYGNEIDFESVFKSLLIVAIALGAIRVLSHFLDFRIPFISGEFNYGRNYGEFGETEYGGTAFRIGGLNDVASLGVPALFAYYVFTKKFNFVALSVLLIYLFLSGGRTIAVGTLVPIFIFSFIFFPRNFLYFIIGGGFIFIIALIFIPENVLEGQTGRITTFSSTNFLGFDTGRALTWGYYWDIFKSNPIFGKGITEYTGYIYSDITNIPAFVRRQLFSGGHGSYISLLSTFGIGGLLYFVIMLYGGIILSYRKINEHLSEDPEKTALAVFAFILLMIKAFDYLTAKNGINIPLLFFTTGIAASITVWQNKEYLFGTSDE